MKDEIVLVGQLITTHNSLSFIMDEKDKIIQYSFKDSRLTWKVKNPEVHKILKEENSIVRGLLRLLSSTTKDTLKSTLL